jgi:hypothetical protein
MTRAERNYARTADPVHNANVKAIIAYRVKVRGERPSEAVMNSMDFSKAHAAKLAKAILALEKSL